MIQYEKVTDFQPIGGVCDGSANDVKIDMTAGVSLCPGKTAILSRSNLTVFSEAVRLTSANPSCRVHFVGVSVCIYNIVQTKCRHIEVNVELVDRLLILCVRPVSVTVK